MLVNLHAAATDTDGEMTLYRSAIFDKSPDRLTKSSSLFADKKNVSEESGFTVQTIDFCNFLKKFSRKTYNRFLNTPLLKRTNAIFLKLLSVQNN